MTIKAVRAIYAVEITAETNDGGESFNCHTCPSAQPLRKPVGDNFSSTAGRFSFRLRHPRLSERNYTDER